MLKPKRWRKPVAWIYNLQRPGNVLALRYQKDLLLVNKDKDWNYRIESVSTLPDGGTPLCASSFSSLPPIDAIFLLGNDDIGRWLKENNWDRDEPYNKNFHDHDLVEAYEKWWASRHPLYQRKASAVSGGWHLSWPEGDWYDLINDELILWTLQKEPWIEVWSSKGKLQVIDRIT